MLLTAREVAAHLKISQRSVWKQLSIGRFPEPVRIGRAVRWRAADVEKFVEVGCDMRAYQAGEVAR